jgi:hypothetical protein
VGFRVVDGGRSARSSLWGGEEGSGNEGQRDEDRSRAGRGALLRLEVWDFDTREGLGNPEGQLQEGIGEGRILQGQDENGKNPGRHMSS